MELRDGIVILRPFDSGDAPLLGELAGRKQTADAMISIPYPYDAERAAADIRHYAQEARSGAGVHFAIACADRPERVIGYVAIKHIDREHAEAELSFWLDEAVRGRGYAKTAVGLALRYAFSELGLNRICAYHMVWNAASARILESAGMRQEGYLRQRVRKNGTFVDVRLWAVLREEFPLMQTT